MGTQAGGRWVDLKDAAEILDTTTEAVRKRAKRGTLPSTTGENGRLYVRVDGQVDDRVDARVDGEGRRGGPLGGAHGERDRPPT